MKYSLAFSLCAAVGCLTNLLSADPVPTNRNEVSESAMRQPGSLAELPRFNGYKVDSYIAAAATLQAVGKDKAAALLTDLAEGKNEDEAKRAILLCRMLFVAKPKGEFRRPAIGSPNFIGPVEREDWPTIFKQWPSEPIELVDEVPFLVVRSYTVGGFPESAHDYLKYCLKNCDWTTTNFKAKTAKEKEAALEKLLASRKWSGQINEEGKKWLTSQID